MITGIRTLPKAIARPINNVPMNTELISNKERTRIPTNKRIREKKIVRSIPKRRDIRGAKGDKKAKANSGKVVIIPARVWLMKLVKMLLRHWIALSLLHKY